MKRLLFGVIFLVISINSNASDTVPVPANAVFFNPVSSCDVYEDVFSYDLNIQANNFQIEPYTGSTRFRCYTPIDNSRNFLSIGMQVSITANSTYSPQEALPVCRFRSDYNQPYVDNRANAIVIMNGVKSVSYGTFNHIQLDAPHPGAIIRSSVIDCVLSSYKATSLRVFGVYVEYE